MKSAARMFDVIGLSVQALGATSVNGPSASRPSGSLSSVRGGTCSGTDPKCGPAAPACGLSACGLSACGLSPCGLSPCGLAGGAPCGFSADLPGCAEPCQSLAGGRSPF